MRGFLEQYIENTFIVEALCRTAKFALEILAFYLLWRLCRIGIEKYRRKNADSQRAGTIYGILLSTLKYVIYFFASVAALETLFNFNLMSVLAAAGVVGIAVAFGAQSVVKDVITGFFILFEGEFEVGDLVTIDGFTGTVESITLRCTAIRNYLGDVYIIPNGSVEKVINHQKGSRALALDVEIAYESDIDTAAAVLGECCKKAAGELAEINGVPEVLGVVALGDSGVKLRALVPCVPGGQFAAERELLRRVKYAFDENGIEIPYNKIIVINKD